MEDSAVARSAPVGARIVVPCGESVNPSRAAAVSRTLTWPSPGTIRTAHRVPVPAQWPAQPLAAGDGAYAADTECESAVDRAGECLQHSEHPHLACSLPVSGSPGIVACRREPRVQRNQRRAV